jgi:hypothetical protein
MQKKHVLLSDFIDLVCVELQTDPPQHSNNQTSMIFCNI